MADVKISALPIATTPLAGTEVLPIVQSATTTQVSIANVTAGRSVSAASLTLTTTPLAVGSGGTGLTSLTAGYIPYGAGTSAFGASSNLSWDSANTRFVVGSSTNNMVVRFFGTSYGVTFNSDASSGFRIEATDPTGVGSFQPLAVNGSILLLQTGGSERMRIDSSGNVGIGTSSPTANARLDVNGSIKIGTGAAAGPGFIFTNANFGMLFQAFQASPALADFAWLNSAGTERARIDSSGNLLVGTTSAVANERLNVTQSGISIHVARFVNSNASDPVGPRIKYTAASPNGTGSEFIYCDDSTALRMSVRSNGGIANYQANDANLSDARLKTDIREAGTYLQKICAIPVRTFKYKDQTHSDDSLGVIAQEVEAIAPELVDVDGFGNTPEDGVPYKAIYQTDLQYALMKAIQELAAKVAELEAKI
jgi:hypothetical protein